MPTKILHFSDDGVSTGFGRISMSVNTRLLKRGYQVMAASIQYDGLLPAMFDGEPLPYHVAALGGKPNWLECTLGIINAYQPDIVMVSQDAPYGDQVRNLQIDWSRYKFIMITPVDGTPIHPNWVKAMGRADAALTISEFGVKGFRDQGVQVTLCRPGVDLDTFYMLNEQERAAVRAKLGITPDTFVFGTFCQNQGRKDIPDTLRIFFEFAKGYPSARLYFDTAPVSPVGWDIPAMCQQFGWDASKLIFREDAMRAGVTHIRERFNLMDVHAVLSHREGYGLPLAESMACGVATMAMDWCSGTEIVGNGKGLLVNPIAYRSVSTWGNALDCYPDIDHAVSLLNRMAENPDERRLIARKGMEWARQHTWDHAADAVQGCIERVLAKRTQPPIASVQTPAPIVLPSIAQPQPDGVVQDVQLMEVK